VIDENRCKQECYPGAIYLHQGRTFFVAKLDMEAGDVLVIKKNVNYFTKALGEKQTTILKTYGSINNPCFRLSFGYLRVTESVTGFQRRRVNNQLLISTEALDLEPSVFETEGFWLEVSAAIQQDIESRRLHFMGGIHALEHAMIGIFPLLVLCDRNDVGGIAFPFHEQLPNAGIFIYDGYHGGVGLCRKAFANFQDLLELTERTIDDCPCEIGCPSCIHSPKCGSGNRPMDKAAALRILKNLRPVDKTSDRFTIKEEEKKQQAGRPQVKEEQRLPPKRYGVFDIETKRSAVEVGGWHRAERMGVSVAVLYDSALDRYCTYLEKDIPNLIHHMQQLDLVVGFNNKRFDNRVLSTYTSFNLGAMPTLDILEEISNRLGYRLSLEKLALHTLQAEKSGNGLQALQWYKEGRFDELIAYCRKDVELTRKLYLYGLHNEYLLFANKAGKAVRLPVEFYRPGVKSRPD
jgi:DEAD/DEAH box helicase domain-containing protein